MHFFLELLQVLVGFIIMICALMVFLIILGACLYVTIYYTCAVIKKIFTCVGFPVDSWIENHKEYMKNQDEKWNSCNAILNYLWIVIPITFLLIGLLSR